MFVDIGYIDNYNPSTGQGRISHTIAQGAQTGTFANFHKEQVHQQELIVRLQKNSYRGVRIWYLFHKQEQTDKVAEIWLSTSEMNPEIKRDYIMVLEKIWFDLELKKPLWLDSVTKSIGGPDFHSLCSQKRIGLKEEKERLIGEAKQQEEARKAEIARERDRLRNEADQMEAARKEMELQRLRQESLDRERRQKEEEERLLRNNELEKLIHAEKRSREIREFCERRNIRTLIHFTRIENLRGILTHGLLSRAELERKRLDPSPIFNDQKRVDGLKDGISLTISYPNYRMFYKLTQGKYGDWVVILLDASVMWNLACAFNSENAASNTMRALSLESRKEYGQLVRMFSDCSQNTRDKLRIPDYYTTDPQAEVLVFERIPTSCIQEIHFLDPHKMAAWRGQNPDSWRDTFRYELKFTRSRSDYEAWITPVQRNAEEIMFEEDFALPPEPFSNKF